MSPTWVQPAEPKPAEPVPAHPMTATIREWAADAIERYAASRPRSRQVAVGLSEAGQPCARRLSYHLAGTPRVALADPWRAEVGTAVHAHLARIFRELDAGSGRFLVEERVELRGVPGTADLFDRRRAMVLDWKTTTSRSRKMRAGGFPSRQELVQVAGYGLALRERGETVDFVALAALPVDGGLADFKVHIAPLTAELAAQAHAAIDRLESLRAALGNGSGPADAAPTPTTLCGWCPWHRADSNDPRIACAGK